MAQAITYTNWWFDQPAWDRIEILFEIHHDLPRYPNIFIAPLHEYIGKCQFYFGFQTNMHSGDIRPPVGKGILFSMWGPTTCIAQARPAPNSWAVAVQDGGAAISIRCCYQWGIGRYRGIIESFADEAAGTWYRCIVEDLSNGGRIEVGDLFFPIHNGQRPLIQRGGSGITSFVELIDDQIADNAIPRCDISFHRDGCQISGGSIPSRATASCMNRPNSEVFYDSSTRVVHHVLGGQTQRANIAKMYQPLF